jgi:transcriptional regulator GlxA family with amidase domain
VRTCWSAFCAADDVPSGTRLRPAVERAARWLAEHPAHPAADDLDALADRCGLSRGRLSRLFAQQIGQPLVSYRQKCRLDFARRLLGHAGRDGTPGRMNLLEAALAAGFGSYSQFYRAHRQHFGTGPAARGAAATAS